MEKDNTQYFNDEWNRPSKPGSETYSLEILDFNEKGIKRYTLEEYKKLQEKGKFNSKNNKPDGRRYKK
jgi:hypothetical protein